MKQQYDHAADGCHAYIMEGELPTDRTRDKVKHEPLALFKLFSKRNALLNIVFIVMGVAFVASNCKDKNKWLSGG